VVSARRVVVVGGGHGGFHVGLFLRMHGFDGSVTVVDRQDRLPYQRPPLSKEFLHGKQELADADFRPRSFYKDHDISLRTGTSVLGIDRDQRLLQLADGDPIAYDDLVLATGSRPRPLAVPGANLPGVLHLAVADDAAALRARINEAERVAVIGGGFIGLEAAAMAAQAGKQVSVFEVTGRLMARAVSAPMSRFFEDLHRSNGVGVQLSTAVSAIQGDDHGVTGVVAGGRRYPADVVVVGVGALPQDQLATLAGLEVDNGIVVRPTLQTSDPCIFAIGDCARFGTRFSRAPAVRLESVQNAVDQAKFVAVQLHEPSPGRAYDAVPWFWTEQFGHKLQIAGLTEGYDRSETVSTGDGKFSVYCYRGDVFVGCESVNAPRDHVRARKELATALGAVPAR
jgi:3-phenylpropionate/trans-cinnamate dioxygenase ferredoxin reductase subunit